MAEDVNNAMQGRRSPPTWNAGKDNDKDKYKDKYKDKDKVKVQKILNMCYIFEKQRVQGYQI